MRLLAVLHRFGVNPALVVGLLLMPAVVAMGYLADRGQDSDLSVALRGSFDGAGPSSPPSRF